MNQKEIDACSDNEEWMEPDTLETEEVKEMKAGSVRQMRASELVSEPFSDIKQYPEDPFSYAETSHIDVQLSTGTLQYEVTDFVLPGKDGFDVAITRTYDSGCANQKDMNPKLSKQGDLITGSIDNNHHTQIFGLGYGWSFALPSIEAVPYLEFKRVEDENGYRYNGAVIRYDYVLHLEDGRRLNINREKDEFYKYHLNDVTIQKTGGTVEHPCVDKLKQSYSLSISYKNGNKDYFRTKKRRHPEGEGSISGYELVARQDKYQNVIMFNMTDYGGMVIHDTWGRILTLEKKDNRLTWKLPSGMNGEPCELTYQLDQARSQRLLSVTNLNGTITRYDYYDPGQYTGKMMYMSKLYLEDGEEEDIDTKERDRPYILLKRITYPSGGYTEFSYGAKTLIKNDAQGYVSHYPVAMKSNGINSQNYNVTKYSYERASTNKYISKATVTRHDDITEIHEFSSQGLLERKEIRHHDISISKSKYTYTVNTKLIKSAVERIVEQKANQPGATISKPPTPGEDDDDGLKSLMKKTYWTYSADNKGNVVKLEEEYPDEPAYNQETNTTYGDHSMVTSVSRKLGSRTIKETYELALEQRVVTCKRIYENDILKEKTIYDYTDPANPYCVTSEKRYVAASGNNLELSGDYAETVYTYGNLNYTHQPVSMEQRGIKDADGKFIHNRNESYQYDNWGRIVTKTDARSQITTMIYDKLGRVIEERLPQAGGQQIVNRTDYYDQACYLVKTDANNQKTRIYYTPFGKIDKVYLAAADTPQAADVLLQTYHYNRWSELTEVNTYDGNGSAAGNIRKTERYTYDSFGRVISRNVPQVGYEETIRYEEMFFDTEDQSYRLREIKTVKGDRHAPDITAECYKDQLGLIRKEWVAGTKLFTYEYDNAGNNIRKTDTQNRVEQTEYDYAGRVITCTKTAAGQQRTTRQEYDALGNHRFSWNEAGMKTEMQYDYAGRVIQIITPFDHRNQRVKYYYDAAGNVIREKRERTDGWHEVSNTYDEVGRLTNTYQYLSQNHWIRTCYQYDVLGNMIWTRNGDTPSGNGAQVIRYTYDCFGNVLTMTNACGRRESSQYDKTGRLLAKTDRNGNRTTYQYDALDRPLKVSVTAKTADHTVTSEQEYQYSKTGKVIRESRREMVTGQPTVLLESRYTYDEKGQLIIQEDPGAVKKVYTYDTYGNRQSFRLIRNHQSGADISLYYLYDRWDRLKQVCKDNAGGVILAEYEYDIKGNQTVMRNPQAGIETRYQYNHNNQMTVLESKRYGAVISSWKHVYGIDGNLLSKTNQVSGPATTITYQYDGLGRLTEENDPGWKRTFYTYDQYSNRIKMMVEGKTKQEPVSVTSYQYDNSNRLELEIKKQGKVTELHRYCYDANGNETFRIWERTGPRPDYPGSVKLSGDWKQQRPTIYEWRHYNGFNQLIKINQDEKEIEYQYRGDGLRHSRKVRKLTERQGKTTVLCWDGEDVVAEQVDGEKKKIYLRGSELIAKESDHVVYYYILNFHGDVEQLWNVNGTRKALYEYDAFGNEKDLNEKDENPFRYCGEYFDVETETVYLRARDYRALTGRFTGEDSYWRSHGNIARRNVLDLMQCTNLYAYGVNNPLNYQDPSGNSAIALPVSPVEGLTYLEYVKICAAISQLDSALVGYADLGAGILLVGGTVYYGGKAVGELYDFLSEPRGRTIVPTDGLAAPSNATRPDTVREGENEASWIQIMTLDEAKAATIAKSKKDEPTIIYRKGSGNATNLTPREVVDITGLSYQLTAPTAGPYTVTSLELINATGKLVAIQDGTNHVSVVPIDITKMPEWIDSRPNALANPHEFTKILAGISIKVK